LRFSLPTVDCSFPSLGTPDVYPQFFFSALPTPAFALPPPSFFVGSCRLVPAVRPLFLPPPDQGPGAFIRYLCSFNGFSMNRRFYCRSAGSFCLLWPGSSTRGFPYPFREMSRSSAGSVPPFFHPTSKLPSSPFLLFFLGCRSTDVRLIFLSLHRAPLPFLSSSPFLLALEDLSSAPRCRLRRGFPDRTHPLMIAQC